MLKFSGQKKRGKSEHYSFTVFQDLTRFLTWQAHLTTPLSAAPTRVLCECVLCMGVTDLPSCFLCEANGVRIDAHLCHMTVMFSLLKIIH